MAEQEKLQLQGLKTIREMQESIQNESMQNGNTTSNSLVKDSEQDTLRAYVKETQKILDGDMGTESSTPDLSHAKTIKESMQDYLDESDTTKPQKTIQDSKQTIAQSTLKDNKATINSQTQAATLQATKTLDSNTPEKVESQGKLDTKVKTEIKEEIESKQEKYQQIVKANANTKQETWLLLDEFLRLSGLEKEKVAELIKDKTIKSKQENGRIYVEASTGTSALIKKVENRLVSLDMNGNALDPVFVEKTIATILGLHDKVLSSKDETIAAFKSENSFLKEALVSMQEIYDDDKKTIEILRQQLQKTQEEVEFVKRKYKLMWGKVSNSTT
ncbi:hypothetical protein C826_01627 [Helicobacter bilis WiWa]|uniref:DUF3972 domain-containing protein n=1 Tax=Helicobacter bilis WiWa TaxID=1235804 RepID=N2BMN8_9HELI|nr:hypothetical protein C826_01627 [Helicobacter bilis WiWa]